MQHGHGAPIARAAAAFVASVALHVCVLLLGGALFFLAPLLEGIPDPDPLIVEMVAGEARRDASPPLARPIIRPRSRPPEVQVARSVPVAVPPVAPSPEAPPQAAEPASPGAPEATLEVASDRAAPSVGEGEAASVAEEAPP